MRKKSEGGFELGKLLSLDNLWQCFLDSGIGVLFGDGRQIDKEKERNGEEKTLFCSAPPRLPGLKTKIYAFQNACFYCLEDDLINEVKKRKWSSLQSCRLQKHRFFISILALGKRFEFLSRFGGSRGSSFREDDKMLIR